MYFRNRKSILSKYKGTLSKYQGILSKYKSILSKNKYTFKLHKYTFKVQKLTLEVQKYTLEVQKSTVEKNPKRKVVVSAIWFNWFSCTVWGLCWYHFVYTAQAAVCREARLSMASALCLAQALAQILSTSPPLIHSRSLKKLPFCFPSWQCLARAAATLAKGDLAVQVTALSQSLFMLANRQFASIEGKLQFPPLWFWWQRKAVDYTTLKNDPTRHYSMHPYQQPLSGRPPQHPSDDGPSESFLWRVRVPASKASVKQATAASSGSNSNSSSKNRQKISKQNTNTSKSKSKKQKKQKLFHPYLLAAFFGPKTLWRHIPPSKYFLFLPRHTKDIEDAI